MTRRTATSALVAIVMLACVDLAAPGDRAPATVRVHLELPGNTPEVWAPIGETLHVAIRRAGRADAIADTTFAVTDSLRAVFTVPLAYAVERFVASADVQYGETVLFIGFEAAELREGADTSLTLVASYVGPGAKAATFELAAADSSLLHQDTARLIRTVRDSGGQTIPNVPARFIAARASLVTVDTAGLLTAVADASDTARVQGFLPTGLSSDMLVRVEQDLSGIVAQVSVSPPSATLTSAGEQVQLSASATDAYGAPVSAAALVWESSLPAVATVDDNGLVTAVSNGMTLISATSNGFSDTSVVSVSLPSTPPPPPPPPADPDPITRTWVGGDAAGPTDWHLGANWNPAGVPLAADSVVIALNVNTPVLTANATVARLRVRGGNVNLGGHTLTVTGDFSTEDFEGTFTMLNAADTLRVQGNALFAGGNTTGLLNAGVLLVGGSFEYQGVEGIDPFRPEQSHVTVFNGPSQQLLRAQAAFEFSHVVIANTGGVRAELTAAVEIEESLRIMTPVALQVTGAELEVGDSLVTVAGSSVTAPRLKLSGPAAVAGAFSVDTVDLSSEGDPIQPLPYRHVELTDSMHLTGATVITGSLVILDEGNLVFDGHTLTVPTLDVGGDASQGLRRARLTMVNPADAMTVTGDAVFDSDASGVMTAGALFVAGTLRVLRNDALEASGTHRVVANGTGAQLLHVGARTMLNTLDIVNATGPVTIVSPAEVAGRIDLNGKLAIRNPIVVDATLAEFDVADSAVTVVGSTLTTSALTLRGAIALNGAFDAGRAEFAGTDQEIPPHGIYSDETTVSGQARLVGATTFNVFTFVHGAQARLTIGGHRLVVGGNFFVGTLDEPTGTLVMTAASDSLVVAGAVSFAGAATATTLTAGTLIVAGGVFTGTEPDAFVPSGTHRTVLNGSAQQVLNIDPAATASRFNHLELANTAGGIWLRSPISVAGVLSASVAGQTISGTSHHLLTVGGIDVNRLTLDTIPLSIQAGAITRFDSVIFVEQNRTMAQLSVAHAGAATPFTFTGLQFLAQPTTGSYVSATDVAADGNVLTIVLDESMPADGSAFTTTSGGAVVQWTGAAGPAFATVSGGIGYSCGLRPNGSAYCWGRNFDGQLGDGTTTQRNVPTIVPAEATFTALVAGGHHTCVLVPPAGGAYCWGANGSGELGDGTQNNATAPQQVTGGLTFTTIAVGEQHTCGLTAAGAAYCWGENGSGQLGDGTNDNRLAPTAVTGGHTFTQIAAKGAHTCALNASAIAYCWGHNLSGQLGIGSTSNVNVPTPVSGFINFASLSAASAHTCGVAVSGAALCWGANDSGQLGDGTQTQRTTPAEVAGGLEFASISGGNGFSCGITTAGAGHCWGANNVGQLGDGTNTTRLTPTPVQGGLTFTSLDAGFTHVVAVVTGGTGYGWGANNEGQLGDGTTTSRTTPTLITPPTP
ncbi:MAG: Ig-like domain-containing protein [Gemmatimonadaceae bacterium]